MRCRSPTWFEANTPSEFNTGDLPHHLEFAGPELIKARSLQKRTDTKFVLPRAELPRFWELLGDDYLSLAAAGSCVGDYETLYLDSRTFHCFFEHLRGRRPRYKVRIRNYVDRNLSYIEVKTKTSRDVTEKQRRARSQGSFRIEPEDLVFINEHSPFSAKMLRPNLRTDFRRVSLVGRSECERVTVDLDLTFSTLDRSRRLSAICIVEVKQPRFSPRSSSFLALRRLGARRVSFSKYCAAAALLCDVPRRRQALARLKGLGVQ